MEMILEPKIVKETSAGLFSCDIQDEMLRCREIRCVGEINSRLVNSIISQLLYLYHQEPEKEITMYINSPGGEVSSGLALYDVMQAIKCPIRTVCVGSAASMGAILFMAGNTREMLPHASVMIHDPLIAGKIGGSALKIQSISEDLMRTREVMAELISKHTGKSIEEVYEVTANDSYFYGKEAIEYGLADKIIETL